MGPLMTGDPRLDMSHIGPIGGGLRNSKVIEAKLAAEAKQKVEAVKKDAAKIKGKVEAEKWQCTKCKLLNFSTRTKCRRCWMKNIKVEDKEAVREVLWGDKQRKEVVAEYVAMYEDYVSNGKKFEKGVIDFDY